MIKKYLQKIYDEAYREGYNSGLVEGMRTERGAIIRVLNTNNDMAAFQDTAKNKTTKVAADGMQIGYEYAVELVKNRVN